ncbi:MAG TPA: Lsr2 family protein [Propionibacteriaceae bacterium]|nr:Lsr2 family protein [Propionibacteriaceae bacterium]
MRKLITQLVDDLDGTEAEETVSFALDGRSYEIDLSHDNATMFRKAMDEYVTHARQAGNARSRKPLHAVAHRDPSQTRAIREWAQRNNHPVSSRGRIPAPVVTAYEAAHDLRG